MSSHRLLAALSLWLALPAAAFDVTRVSLDEQGDQLPRESTDGAISADGRYLAFTTTANLAPADSNGFEDIYLKDLEDGTVTLLSRPNNASPPDRPSRNPAISDDGSRVVFASSATNLVPGDNAGKADVFMYDRVEETLVRVSRGFDGGEANGTSARPDISADGRVIVFESAATNLVDGDTNGFRDVFLFDLVSGLTRRVSVTSAGEELNGPSSSPSVSADGLKVAFSSLAPLINPRGDSGLDELFTHSLTTRETERVRIPPVMTENSDLYRSPHLSPDGGWLAFTRTRDGGGGLRDVLLQHLDSGETLRVTQPIGAAEQGFSVIGGISKDGEAVAFDSVAENLIPGDRNGQKDVFLYRRSDDEVIRVSGPGPNAGGNGESRALDLTPDGLTALFASRASNLVDGDTNGAQDIFANDLEIFALDSAISGSWYDKSQDGHGFVVEYLPGNQLVFYWFTFTPGGDREWIFGVLDVNGTVAEGDAFRKLGDGARFPPNIDPAAIDNDLWGTIRFEFEDCDSGTVSWNASPPYADGSMDLSRLTAIPALECP